MRWTRQCQKTNDTDPPSQGLRRIGTRTAEGFFERRFADGEDVWSWRPDAGAKLAMMLRIIAGDGGKRARSPGRARYKP